MKPSKTIPVAIGLALAATLLGGCAKSESASPTASQPVAAPTDTVAGLYPTVPPAGAETQPTPGSPVATFTPSADGAAPMLPILGTQPIAPPSDEHAQTPEKADVRRIAPEEAAMLVQTGDAILVDVRSKEAFQMEHIRGAVHMPYAEIAGRARQELQPTRWIIPYCT
jgi:hypothetical protein